MAISPGCCAVVPVEPEHELAARSSKVAEGWGLRMDARSWGSRTATLVGALAVAIVAGLPAVGAAPLRAQAPATVGTDWPFYGADLGNTRTSIGGPAKAGVPTLVPRWRFDAQDGDFTGTPVVVAMMLKPLPVEGPELRSWLALEYDLLWTRPSSSPHEPHTILSRV